MKKSEVDTLRLEQPPRKLSVSLGRNTVVEIIAASIILLFMYAAISKMLDYNNFKIQLSKSPFITNYAILLSWSLPLLEILICIMLLIKRIRMIGFYAALFLMSAFTTYIYAMLRFADDLPCSCGGVLEKMTWKQHLWFNILFTILTAAAILVTTLKIQRR